MAAAESMAPRPWSSSGAKNAMRQTPSRLSCWYWWYWSLLALLRASSTTRVAPASSRSVMCSRQAAPDFFWPRCTKSSCAACVAEMPAAASSLVVSVASADLPRPGTPCMMTSSGSCTSSICTARQVGRRRRRAARRCAAAASRRGTGATAADTGPGGTARGACASCSCRCGRRCARA
jgi:hypothetical protein